MPWDDKSGEALRNIRDGKKVSYSALVEASGLSQTMMNNWLSGENAPTDTALAKMAKVLIGPEADWVQLYCECNPTQRLDSDWVDKYKIADKGSLIRYLASSTRGGQVRERLAASVEHEPLGAPARTALVGREGLVKDFLAWLGAVGPRVRRYHGPSGVGKSRLCLALREMLNGHCDIITAVWDFSAPDMREAERALLGLRDQLVAGGVSCRRFDLGHIVYQQRRGHRSRPTAGFPAPLRDEVLAELEGFLTLRPFEIPQVAELDGKVRAARQWWIAEGRAIFEGLRVRSPDELARPLAELLARDAVEAQRRPIIFVDAHETVLRHNDAWLRMFADKLSTGRLVLFGTQPMDTDWSGSGSTENVKVELLDDEACEAFLIEHGVVDPAVRAAIREFAAGLPIGLDSALDIVKRNDVLSPELFRFEAAPDHAREDAYQRFTRHLPEDEVSVLHVMSVPRVFDAEIFSLLTKHAGLRTGPTSFHKFISNPSVQSAGHGRYIVHRFVRETALKQRLTDWGKAIESVHGQLHQFYGARVREIHDASDVNDSALDAVAEWRYHGAFVNLGLEFVDELREVHRNVARAGRSARLDSDYRELLGMTGVPPVVRAVMTLLLAQSRRERAENEGLDEGALEAAKVLAEHAPDTRAHYYALLDLGELHGNAGRLGEALKYAQAALDGFERLGDRRAMLFAMNTVGMYSGRRGDALKRLECYRACLELAEQDGSPDTGLYRNNYAYALAEIGDFEQALSLHLENLEHRRRIGDVKGEAITLGAIARCRIELGHYEAAIESNEEAIRLSDRVGAKGTLAMRQILTSTYLTATGRPADALLMIAPALSLQRRNRNATRLVKTLIEAADAHFALGELDAARKLLSEAMGLAAEKGYREREDELLSGFGRLLVAEGDPKGALEKFDESWRRGLSLSKYRQLASTAVHRATALRRIGDQGHAVGSLLQAQALCEIMGVPETIGRWHELARERASDEPWTEPTPSEREADREFARLSAETSVNRYLVPSNLETERSEFLRNDRYEPRFEYPPAPRFKHAEWSTLVAKLDPGRPMERLLINLCARTAGQMRAAWSHNADQITAFTSYAYGRPDAALLARARAILAEPATARPEATLDADVARARLQAALDGLDAAGWTIVVTRDMHARLSVFAPAREIRVRADARFSEAELKGLVAHEIGTHVLRAVSGGRQPLSIFATGLPGYLATEEGLALYHERAADPSTDLRRAALRVLATDWALEHGFREVFSRCMELVDAPELCFQTTLRVKRGLGDVNRPGAHTKDVVYLTGYDAVRVRLAGADAEDVSRLLLVGKVGIDDLPNVRSAVASGWLIA